MLYEYSEELYGETMSLINEKKQSDKSAAQKLSDTLNVIKEALNKLREFITDNPFESDVIEIDFFKNIKPKLYSRLIFYVELFAVDKDVPFGTVETLKNYYSQELDFRTTFFKRNQFLYDYYHLRMTELDELYFLRNAKSLVVTSEIPEINPGFSTNCDYLFSKFIAYEDLSAELLRRINELCGQPFAMPSEKEVKNKLTWTGDKVNIAELAYGLYYTGQINGGNCDVAEIISWLEDTLNLQMGSVHRKFIDIRRRKTISHTKFLDSMREAINKRIDEDLAYKPNRGIKLQNSDFNRSEDGFGKKL